MQAIWKSPRSGCALHGALSAVTSINGVVPIVHSNAGCAMQDYLAGRAGGGGQGRICGENVPSTNAQERHIIFGGASRLREQMKNTQKVVNGELYLVLNSCESAMVGDDVEAMTREAREQGMPVIECLAAGFHGDSHYGYEAVMTDVMKKLGQVKKLSVETDQKLVNVFGILPGRDVYFRGNLEAVKKMLEGIGVKANIFFGPVHGAEELFQAQNAALNIVFSKWGLAPARQLESQYRIPGLTVPALPLGPEETADFLRQIAAALSLNEEPVKDYLAQEKIRFDYYYESILENFFESGASRTAAIVGDESDVIRIAGFLKKYLGVRICAAVVTDCFEKQEILQKEQAGSCLSGIAEETYFTQDGKEINDILTHSGAELILGSSLEHEAAEKKGMAALEISFPIYGRMVTNQNYVGIDGALALSGDYLTVLKKSNALKEEQLERHLRAGGVAS